MLNSKERVLLALNHQRVDRVPLDLGGWVTTIHQIAYNNLIQLIGIPETEREVHDWIRQTVIPDEKILNFLGIDFRHIFPGKPNKWKFEIREEGNHLEVIDEWGVKYHKPKNGGYYFDAVSGPLQKQDADIKSIDEIKWPDPNDSGYFNNLKNKAKQIHKQNKFALVGEFAWETWYERSWKIRGFDKFYMDLALNPDFAVALIKKVANIHMQFLKNALKECGEYLDVVVQGGDFGTQSSLIFSPQMFRKHIKPILAQVIELIKKNTSAKVFYHSCGAIAPIINDLIEIGIDILNPFQVSAEGMNPEELKKSFGNKLSFWGGIDTQSILPFGTTKEVSQEVKRVTSIMNKNGGYILSAVHNIQPEVPPENIEIMYRTARELKEN